MANGNPNPGDPTVDPAQAEVLLASNIADDDLQWVVRCSIEELHRLFQDPVPWVASLATLPGWVDALTGKTAPEAVLTPDFGMTVVSTTVEDPDGWVVVQGIGGTNQLSVVANRAGALRSLLATDRVAEAVAKSLGKRIDEAQDLSDAELLAAGTAPFGPFWDLVSQISGSPAQKKPLTVDVLLAISRFCAHFEILDKGESPEERAQRTASFLLASVFDPEGEAAMFNSLAQETMYVDRGQPGKMGEAITLLAATAPQGFYANIQGEEGMESGVAPDCICVSFNGPYAPPNSTGGQGTISGGMLKRWGVECF